MTGVILFADNKVFESNSFENLLFVKLAAEDTLTVLPICSLPDLELTIKTISTCRALILDWNFDRDNILGTVVKRIKLYNELIANVI